ncbi:hypothetical protein [Latilactobacillus fragifolii]|uniref:hypothetical protein n=1 Tax=Latilactobacillus fragifolii TaxID=2814244 RepID=UPI001ABA56FF|nr:hypothetical protein [Latilactobacillus fragifolii]
MEATRWYLFDPETGKYLFNYVDETDSSLEDRPGATTIDPGDIMNPVWDGEKWQQGKAPEPVVPEPTEQDQINATLIKQNLQLTKELNALKGDKSNG